MNPRRARRLVPAMLCAAGLLVAVGLARAAAGHLDRSFGHGGFVTIPSRSGDAHGVTTDSHRRVVAAGFCPASACMVRYTSKGRLDRSFSGDGMVRPRGFDAWDVAMDSGRIVMAGDSLQTAPPAFVVSRYRRHGHLDRSFSRDGLARIRMKGGYAALNTVAIDSKGRIVLAGYVVSSRVGHLALVRYLPDGRLDKSFGDHGKVIRKFPFFSDGSIALDSRNRIVAGASDLNHHFELLRFRVGGTLDKSFGSGGVVTTNIPGSLTTVMIDRQDRILAAGQGFDSPVVLARFRPSGRPDRDFGTDGVVNSNFGGPGATYVYDGAIGLRGRIVVAGRNNRRFALARYKPNGVLDPSFGEHGVVEKPGGTADALAVDSKGRPVAAGLHEGRFTVARYTGP